MRFIDAVLNCRVLNPHRRHGYVNGPDHSPFWFDLESACDLLETSRSDIPGFDVWSLRQHLASVQRYQILRAATYRHYADVTTIGAQLERARTYILDGMGQETDFTSDRDVKRTFLAALRQATIEAGESLTSAFAQMAARPFAGSTMSNKPPSNKGLERMREE